MKFSVEISTRAVRDLMICINNNLQQMPYTTELYFLKVQDIMCLVMDNALVELFFENFNYITISYCI